MLHKIIKDMYNNLVTSIGKVIKEKALDVPLIQVNNSYFPEFLNEIFDKYIECYNNDLSKVIKEEVGGGRHAIDIVIETLGDDISKLSTSIKKLLPYFTKVIFWGLLVPLIKPLKRSFIKKMPPLVAKQMIVVTL